MDSRTKRVIQNRFGIFGCVILGMAEKTDGGPRRKRERVQTRASEKMLSGNIISSGHSESTGKEQKRTRYEWMRRVRPSLRRDRTDSSHLCDHDRVEVEQKKGKWYRDSRSEAAEGMESVILVRDVALFKFSVGCANVNPIRSTRTRMCGNSRKMLPSFPCLEIEILNGI